MTLPRLRQLVFASRDQSDIEQLRQILSLGRGFVDPGVAAFGLTNGVFALGDQFLEVVVPVEDETAAGRFIDRTGGQGGYMAIFQTDDLASVRQRADALEIRRVWDVDLSEISASHLHPADIGGAIVSVDEARPAASWLWGGPDWEKTARPGRIRSLIVSAKDPEALSARWGAVLGLSPQTTSQGVFELALADSVVRFEPGEQDRLIAYDLVHPDAAACLARAQAADLVCDETSFSFAGVSISISAD